MKIPIDLVVSAKGEYDIISNDENTFSSEIKETGKALYEKK